MFVKMFQNRSITVCDFKPFFYVKLETTGVKKKDAFFTHLKGKVGKYHENNIVSVKIAHRKKLYGFDAGKKIRSYLSSLKIFRQ